MFFYVFCSGWMSGILAEPLELTRKTPVASAAPLLWVCKGRVTLSSDVFTVISLRNIAALMPWSGLLLKQCLSAEESTATPTQTPKPLKFAHHNFQLSSSLL